MNFNEKLQALRKKKGLTQEELAASLYVSRTAISKWESGRGYPSIDSLREIANFFDITIDELLSGEELLSIADEYNRQKEKHFCDLVFGLLDVSTVVFLFMPLFGQRASGAIEEVSLLSLDGIAAWLKLAYLAVSSAIVLCGILLLALQNCPAAFWIRSKSKISLALNILGVLLFIISMQPYAATFLFIFLAIKVLLLAKKR